MRVIGIDPGTVSFDACGLQDGQVFLDASVPSPDIARDPHQLVELLRAHLPLDLVVGPSGYGLPLTPIAALGPREIAQVVLVRPDEAGRAGGVGGLPQMLRGMAAARLPVLLIPGVIHLPTVPAHRKANRIDMGTADKLCVAALAIADQARQLDLPYAATSLILVELGGAFSAVLAIAGGQVVDGLGGTSGPPGFRSAGALDGEVAYQLGELCKQTLFTGGARDQAGQPDLAPEQWVAASRSSPRLEAALDAFVEGIAKAVAAELVVVPRPCEIVLSGRLCRAPDLFELVAERQAGFAPVRRLAGFAAEAKEAAQGAAILADGLAGGRYHDLVARLRLREAAGSALDYLAIPGVEGVKAAYGLE
jgi:predicted butyrate kinase (DUF1464 family)